MNTYHRSLPAILLAFLFTTASAFGQTSVVQPSSKTEVSFSSHEDDVSIGDLTFLYSVERALSRARSKQKPVILMRVLGHLGGGV